MACCASEADEGLRRPAAWISAPHPDNSEQFSRLLSSMNRRGRAMSKPLGPTTLLEVRTGKPKPFGGGRLTSAIQKDVRNGAVGVTALGFEGDEQADRNFHGGPDKA